MTPPLTVGSLFSGIGGLDLGLERAGMVVKWQVECDPYARKVLRKHWPAVLLGDDVRDVYGPDGWWGRQNPGGALPRVDVICGGFPCQDISNAGKRAGIDGARSGLWSEFHRLIDELAPKWVVVENVAALRSRGLDRVLRDLASSGYDAEWDCVRASEFGAPHRRERLFVVAYPSYAGVEGRLSWGSPRTPGPWGWRGEEDLRAVADAPFVGGDRWPAPLFRRVAHGISDRVGRTRGAGNAVVPQVAEFVGRLIVSAEAGT